jgi:hypothetical protein
MANHTTLTPLSGNVPYKWQPPRRLFTGAYKTSSPEYSISATHACLPPAYHRQVLVFHGIFDALSPLQFYAGQFITVGIDPPSSPKGHSVFGYSYHVHTSLNDGQPEGYNWEMEVEVHTIPGYKVDWQYARPFPTPPIGSVFIQPHGFKETEFELLRPSSPERWDRIRVDLGWKAGLFNPRTRIYYMTLPESRLPPYEAYPQNERHGVLIPAQTLIKGVAHIEDPRLEPVRPTLPPLLTLLFDREARYLCDWSINEAARRRSDPNKTIGRGIAVLAPPPPAVQVMPPPQYMQTFASNMQHLRNKKIRSDKPAKHGFEDYVAGEDLFENKG